MKGLIEVIRQLLRSKAFWKVVTEIALGLLALVREQKSAQTDVERAKAGATLEVKLEEARLKRMELEIEMKRREVDLQKATFELEKLKIEAARATSRKKAASAQKAVAEATKENESLSERVDEVAHTVAVLKRVEEAGDARDLDTLVAITSALVPVEKG